MMNDSNLRFTACRADRLTFAIAANILRNATTALAFFIFAMSSFAQDVMYNNGNIRIGNGAENSINAKGNLQQPFYHNGTNWIKLTYSNIALNATYAVGGIGTNQWNTNGELKNDPVLIDHNLDLSAFNNGAGTIISSGLISFSGTNLMVETTYQLLPETDFMKITTRLINPGNVTIPNVRMWIGTRDDYVGSSDNPYKQRGNLVEDQFELLSDASKRGKAIQVTSGQEGLLLYSESDKTHSILQNCCNWNNIINQNPISSNISSNSDASYGLFFRFANLAPGAGDEITWFYAAGAIDEFEEIVQSVAQAASPVTQITCTSATFKPSETDSGTGYYLVVSDTALPPTSQQIHNGDNYEDVTVIAAGNAELSAGIPLSFEIQNLQSEGEYALYYTVEVQPNTFSTPKRYTFETLAPVAINLESFASSVCGPNGNGSVISNVTGGLPPYVYLWSSGDTTHQISAKPAGEYTLQVNDLSGCPAASATTAIEVEDYNPPVAMTQPLTLYYDSTGSVLLNASQVDDGSFDDCGIDAMELSHTSFQCNSQSNTYHTVILSVYDLNGNMDEEVALIQIYDTISPQILAQNLVVFTDSNGIASASAALVDAGSTDNCTLHVKQLSKSVFDCTDLGANTITYTVTDGYGNSSSQDIIITVLDTIMPVAVRQNFVLELDENGQAFTDASMADAGSFDNCALAEINLSKTSFDCSDLGENTVLFTVTDISGNTTTVPITITIVDRIHPIIDSPDEVSTCAGPFDVNIITIAHDICGASIQQISGPQFGDELRDGTYQLIYRATDLAGNTSDKSVSIDVQAGPVTTLQESYDVPPGTNFQITAGNHPNQRYLWSTGDTSNTISIQLWEETSIWVRIENEAGCARQEEVLLKMSDSEEQSPDRIAGSFLIYPNPAFNDLNIRFNLPEKLINVNLLITDSQGRIIRRQILREVAENDLIAIDIANFSQGIYQISLTALGLNHSMPFVKY